MKAIKYSLALTGLVLCLTASSQQRSVKLELGYKAAVPVGNFKNISGNTSLNGWEAAIMYGLTDQISLGVQTGFQDFYQKNNRTVLHGSGNDLSAVITNSVQVTPLLVRGKYAVSETGAVRPFAALGVGGSLVQYRKYYGQFADSRSALGFMAQPEIGLQAAVGRAKRTNLYLAAAYNYAPFQYSDADGLHHAAVKAGVAIPLR